MNREGLFIPYQKIPTDFWKRIPSHVKGLGNSFDRGFGDLLAEELDLPHGIPFLEFRLAEATKMRWGISEQQIVGDRKEALRKAERAAQKDKAFVDRLVRGTIEFQK